MKKFDVEMSYNIMFSLSDVETDSEEDAVKKAKKMVENEVLVIDSDTSIDCGNPEFECVTYIEEG